MSNYQLAQANYQFCATCIERLMFSSDIKIVENCAVLCKSYLENNGLVILAQIVGKYICVHECSSAFAQNIHCFLEELCLDPGHVVLLHFLHFFLENEPNCITYNKKSIFKVSSAYPCHLVQFVFKLQRLQVVHVSIAIEKVALQGRSGFVLAFSG